MAAGVMNVSLHLAKGRSGIITKKRTHIRISVVEHDHVGPNKENARHIIILQPTTFQTLMYAVERSYDYLLGFTAMLATSSSSGPRHCKPRFFS
jgi:hypothetical protein